MKAMCCSETSVEFLQSTRPYVPEDRPHHEYTSENLRSYRRVYFANGVSQLKN
jgi:hypothetical protein